MFRPTQFGKYYLTERIAVGGMAELFKAKLFGVSGFEKPMVVKQILPKYARNAEFIKMFIDEAKIAVTLTHGNIVPVYELGRIDGVYFIAMEYVPGKDLADILETARAKNAPLTIEHAVFLTIEICKGLDYAHRRTDPDGNPLRVVHRDISPPNVLVSFDGEVKITDFGIAKATHKLGSTEAGVVKGTFGYMSPEQVRGLPVNHKTDIFSAGILLHEMLTGRRLFVGESEYDAIERVKAARVPAPSSLNPKVPAAIDPIVYKALAKDPADRYTDANEFQLALSRFLFTSGSGATSSTLSRTMKQLFGDEEEKRRAELGSEEIFSQLPAREHDNTLREGIGARPRSEDSQIFAARSEIGNAETVVSEHPAPELLVGPDGTVVDRSHRRPQVVDVGAGKGVAISATMALPSLAPGEAAELAREYDDERTNVFKGARPPQRPEVPELRFPPKAEKEPRLARPDPLPSPGPIQGFPSSEELASLADALDDALGEVEAKPPSRLPAPGGRSPEPAPAPPPARPAPARTAPPAPAPASHGFEEGIESAARSTSDSGLLGLLARPPSAEMPPVGAPPSEEIAPAHRPASEVVVERSALRPSRPRTGSEQLPGRPKRISGIVSSTMRLFVDGIEEEEPAPAPDLPAAEEEGSSDLDHVPRTIKPTVLGWIVILIVVLGAAGFVVYKKTSLFRTPTDEGGDLVRPEDLKRATQKPSEKKGTISLASAPEGASFFQFVGETPVTLGQLDPGRTHLLRLEREGYHPVYQTVDAKSWGGTDKAAVKVTLNPAGAGAEEGVPEVPETAATGKPGALQVASDPPVAMVWLLVGKGGKVELKDLDASKSYNFKALLKGHQQVLVNVAPVDFDRKTGIYKTVVRLEPDGSVTEAGAKPSPDAGAKPEPKLEPKPEPKLEPKPEPKLEPKPKPEPKLKVKVQPKPKPKIKIKRPPPKKKKKEEKKAGPKLPDWAR